MERENDGSEKQWEEERTKLKNEVNHLQFQKKFWILHNKKLVVYLKKIAHVTCFRGGFNDNSKETGGEESSNCDVVPNELLDELVDHVKNKFEGGGTGITPKEVEEVVVQVVKEQSLSPDPPPPSQHPCPPPSPPVSQSSVSVSTSSRKSGKPKKKRAKKVICYLDSDDDENDDDFKPTPPRRGRPPSRKVAVKAKVIKKKIASAVHECNETWDSIMDCDKHKEIVCKVVTKLRNHSQFTPVILPKSALPPPSSSSPSPPPPPAESRPSEAQLVPGLVNCTICGGPLSSMAALNFHMKKKHNFGEKAEN